jgi:tRNA-binding EMAP/Myf-like protein
MKFTLSWLKDHLETSASLAELTDKLSSMGLDVEGVDNPAANLEAFTIARVLDAKPHPNADRLKVCKVDTGSGVVEVVCGAPNAKTGMIGVFAGVGTFIPGTKITLEARPVRGVVSNGMLVSERSPALRRRGDHQLAPDREHIGKRYADVLSGDPVIEVKLTPNRPIALAARHARDRCRWQCKLEPRFQRRGDYSARRHQVDFLKICAPACFGRPLRGANGRRWPGCGSAEGRGCPITPGRRHQLHQPRSRPAPARLRCRKARGRHPRAARQEG